MNVDPNHGTPYTDGARAAGADAASEMVSGAISPADTYLDAFPYLNTPRPGSRMARLYQDDTATQHHHAVVSLAMKPMRNARRFEPRPGGPASTRT